MKKPNSKGITLVALIITIVVLLILAAVSIGAVQDSGIIGYAKNATTEYNQSKIDEEGTVAGYEVEIDKYLSNIEYYYFKYTDNGKEGEGIWVVDYKNKKLKGYMGALNEELILTENLDVTSIKGNETSFNITVDGEEVIIPTSAKEITTKYGKSYIVGENFYSFISEGDSLQTGNLDSGILYLIKDLDISRLKEQ